MNFIEFVGDFLKCIFFSILALGLSFCICFAIALGIMGLYELFNPESTQKRAEEQKAEATPQVYSKVDGCTIYKWRDNGYWHYMTKCADTVTTEGHRSKMVGKISKDVSETIITKRGE